MNTVFIVTKTKKKVIFLRIKNIFKYLCFHEVVIKGYSFVSVLLSGISVLFPCEIDCVKAARTFLLDYFYYKIERNKKKRVKEESTVKIIDLTGSKFLFLD